MRSDPAGRASDGIAQQDLTQPDSFGVPILGMVKSLRTMPEELDRLESRYQRAGRAAAWFATAIAVVAVFLSAVQLLLLGLLADALSGRACLAGPVVLWGTLFSLVATAVASVSFFLFSQPPRRRGSVRLAKVTLVVSAAVSAVFLLSLLLDVGRLSGG